MPPGGAADDAEGGCWPGASFPCLLGPRREMFHLEKKLHFMVKTMNYWNSLPKAVVESPKTGGFQDAVGQGAQ